MTKDEYFTELRGLMDSLDDHITRADAAQALRTLADDVESSDPWTEDEVLADREAEAAERYDPSDVDRGFEP